VRHPSYCKRCKLDVDSVHWYWQKSSKCKDGGYWRCKQENRDNVKRWRSNNLPKDRLNAYKNADKRSGLVCTISVSDVERMIAMPCFYCSLKPANGLDRKNSDAGHTPLNVVPCCEKCNFILGDIPFEAKERLVVGLHSIRQSKLLNNWTIPTKRS